VPSWKQREASPDTGAKKNLRMKERNFGARSNGGRLYIKLSRNVEKQLKGEKGAIQKLARFWNREGDGAKTQC